MRYLITSDVETDLFNAHPLPFPSHITGCNKDLSACAWMHMQVHRSGTKFELRYRLFSLSAGRAPECAYEQISLHVLGKRKADDRMVIRLRVWLM